MAFPWCRKIEDHTEELMSLSSSNGNGFQLTVSFLCPFCKSVVHSFIDVGRQDIVDMESYCMLTFIYRPIRYAGVIWIKYKSLFLEVGSKLLLPEEPGLEHSVDRFIYHEI